MTSTGLDPSLLILKWLPPCARISRKTPSGERIALAARSEELQVKATLCRGSPAEETM